MRIIAAMNTELQNLIPDQIGIYDDAFNINCIGDTMQTLKIPTVLFEAGHYPSDYGREETRRLMYVAILTALKEIAEGSFKGDPVAAYQAIPQNKKSFYDIILRNAKLNDEDSLVDIAIQFQEVLEGGKINFIPKVEKKAAKLDYYGHREVDLEGAVAQGLDGKTLDVGYENDIVVNNELFSLKLDES